MDISKTRYALLTALVACTTPERDISRILSSTVLDVGTFSGFSAITWYVGTKRTEAEIVTLEMSKEMIVVAKDVFERQKLGDRIKLVEGPASER